MKLDLISGQVSWNSAVQSRPRSHGTSCFLWRRTHCSTLLFPKDQTSVPPGHLLQAGCHWEIQRWRQPLLFRSWDWVEVKGTQKWPSSQIQDARCPGSQAHRMLSEGQRGERAWTASAVTEDLLVRKHSAGHRRMRRAWSYISYTSSWWRVECRKEEEKTLRKTNCVHVWETLLS